MDFRAIVGGVIGAVIGFSWVWEAEGQKLSDLGRYQAKPCPTTIPKDMVCIPGGRYIRGSEKNAHHPLPSLRVEAPQHTVFLDTFFVDKYEVTNDQYFACMKAGVCKKPAYLSLPKTSMWKRFRTGTRPFVRATFPMARTYCTWAGKRLLTEAEWEAAARGPKGETYPWGEEPPSCKVANYRVFPPHTSYPKYAIMRFCPPPYEPGRDLLPIHQDQTWPVGSTPAFRGIYDMAGNGYEWVQDFFDPHAYAACSDPEDPRCTRVNPKGPCEGQGDLCRLQTDRLWRWNPKPRKGEPSRSLQILKTPKTLIFKKRILKGGSWWWYADHLRSAYRRPDGPETGTHRLSIRCGSSEPVLRSP